MGIRKKVRLRNLAYLVVSLFLASCATLKGSAGTGGMPAGAKIDYVETDPDIKEKLPLKVAILPFENLTGKKEAFEIVRRAFYNHFASKKYQDIELYRVDTTLGAEGLLEGNAFLSVPSKELGEKLGADGLVYGKITGFDRIFLGAYSQVAVELEAKLVKASTGETLWKAKHKRTHHEGGVPLDPISVIPTVIRTALNIRDIELLRTAEDLSREMLATLPEPTIAQELKSPKIEFVAHDSAGAWKKAGDVIRVGLVGESDMIATFDMGDMKKGLPMTEEKKGVYSGSYRVMPGDMLKDGLVVGHLTDERGNRSDWVDPLSVVNIDTKPPDRPSAPEAFGRDSSVFLRLAEKQSEDVFEYRIQRSESPKDGFVEIAKTELSSYHDQGLKNGVTYYYRISALDRAGNESEPSDAVPAMPLEPGPTPVSEDVQVDATWYAASSPYVIKKTVKVLPGASLTIEPGCVVRSEGAAIMVRGKLIARGNAGALIQFLGADEEKAGVAWEGVVFDNAYDSGSQMAFCKIKQARAGITMITSSPSISDCIVTENGTGLDIQEFSKPVIRRNIIANNQEEGILCERSEPEVTENTIKENLKEGISCRNSSPLIRTNNIYGNQGFDLQVETMSETIVAALNNWWGTTSAEKIAAKIKGPVSYATVLDGPHPEGKPIELEKSRREATGQPVPAEVVAGPKSLDQEEVARLMKDAQEEINQGKHVEAARTLLRVVGADEGNHRAWFLLGMSYYQMGNAAEALKSMEKAVAIDVSNVGYHYNLGLAYSDTGNAAKAVEEWRKVLTLDPQNQNAKMLLEMYGAGKK
jgi:hypothetical protein